MTETVSALEEEVALLKKELEESRTELEAVNTSTHLGIWKCFYNEDGTQKGVIYTDEFRRMPGFSRKFVHGDHRQHPEHSKPDKSPVA